MTMDLQKYYQRQVSFTEWFEQIKHARTDEMREEDNEKRERLKVLNEIIGLPFDKPVQFGVEDIVQVSPAFEAYVAEHGKELCALRLIPLVPSLPKLRIRGKSVCDSLNWFREQAIDPKSYRADFVPHSEDVQWSTCFVINENGIFGEIIRDQHTHLTQGFYGGAHQPITFYYNGHEWRLTEEDSTALAHLKEVVGLLAIEDRETQAKLTRILNVRFSRDYLHGYFETVASLEFGTWFIDYNRVLGEMYRDFVPHLSKVSSVTDAVVKGQTACGGIARGQIRIVLEKDISTANFNEGDILVCDMTSPLYIPLMQKAAAIITDRGGILSHAAIVSRELGKPCITGTKRATRVLKDGDRVEVDADSGIIKVWVQAETGHIDIS